MNNKKNHDFNMRPLELCDATCAVLPLGRVLLFKTRAIRWGLPSSNTKVDERTCVEVPVQLVAPA